MIEPINRKHLNLIRGGGAANAPRVQWKAPPRTEPGDTPPTTERSPLARNVESLVIDAYNCGRQHGEKQHYVAGWRMGLLSGAFSGAVAGAALVALLQWAGAL